jgi:FMN phosphatase YigB (HAD superfamily)
MTELLLPTDITDVHPGQLQARGIKLIGVDLENVACAYHIPGSAEMPTVRPEVITALRRMKAELDDLKVVLVTNNSNRHSSSGSGLVTHAVRSLNDVLDDRLPAIYPSMGFKRKPSAEMLLAAARITETPPEQAAMVDDQSKVFLATVDARYRAFFWTRPYGTTMHPGVKLFHRYIERPIFRPAAQVFQGARDIGKLLLSGGY